MAMKDFFIFLVLCGLPLRMQAQIAISRTDKSDGHGAWEQKYAMSNPYASHTVNLYCTANTEKTPASFNIGVPEPYTAAVGRHAGLFKMTVNGINMKTINIDNDAIATFKDDKTGCAGVCFPGNFDGAKVEVKIFLKTNSPLLFISISPALEMISPINSVQVEVMACVNLSTDAKIRWDRATYERESITPVRSITSTDRAGVALKPNENSVIFQDKKFSSGSKNYSGVGYIVFDNTDVTEAVLRNGPYQIVNFTLKPDFKTFTFAAWRSKNILGNEEFQIFYKENPWMFSMEGKK